MSDVHKTKAQLIEELASLRARLEQLEAERSGREHAEEALQEGEERFRLLFENTPIGVYRTTPDGRILNANPALVKMLGYSSLEEVTLRNLQEEGFEPPYSRDEFRERVEREGIVTGLEGRWKKRDGSVVFVRENARVFRDADGRVLYYDGTAEDITERKQMEDALRLAHDQLETRVEQRTAQLQAMNERLQQEVTERRQGDDAFRASEERYRALFERAADAVVLLRPEDGAILEFNDRAHEQLGYSREEFRHLKVSDIEALESAEDVASHIEKVLREGADTFETKHRTKAGELRDILVSCRAIKHHGQILCQAIWADITERKRAEAAHLESEERHRTLVETIPYGVQEIDMHGKILFSSSPHHKMMGWPEGELHGKHIDDLIAGEEEQHFLRDYLATLVKEQPPPTPYVTKNRTKDGRLIDVQVDWNYKRNQRGEVTGFISVISDITERKQAEEALRQSEERHARAAAIAHFGHWEWYLGEDRRIWSEETCRIFGVDPGRAAGTYESFQDFVHPDDRESVKQAVEATISRREPLDVEYRIIRPDGVVRVVHSVAELRADQTGQPVAMVGTLQDITERRRAEGALRESEARQRLILGSLPIALYTADASGDFGASWVSDQIKHISGFAPEQWVADPEFWAAGLHPDDRRRALSEYGALLVNDKVVTEYRWRCADGTYRWFLDQAVLIRDERGKPKEAIGTWLDITERRQTEEALRESELKFRALVQTVAAATFIFQDESIVYANPAAEVISGYSQDELLQMNFWDVIHPDSRDLVRSRGLARQKGEAVPAHYEVQILTKDGQVRWVDFTAGMIDFDNRLAVLGTAFDITERKRVEQALRESERRFRAIFDQTYQFIGLMTPDGTLIEANRSALNFAGIEESDVLGKPFWETPWWAHSPELQERLRAAVRDAAAGHFVRFEASHPAPDGSLIDIDFSLKPVMDESGNVALLIPEGRDITERKKAEEALRESEERIEAILENTTAVIYLKDTAGRYLLVNRRYRQLFHLTQEDVLGKTDFDIFPQEQAAAFYTNDQQVLESRTPVEFEELAPHDDGLHTYISIKFPLFDTAGEPYAVCGISTDITSRKRGEEDLRLFKTISDSAPYGCGITDLDGILLYVNDAFAKMHGDSSEELVGKHVSVLHTEEQMPVVRRLLSLARREGSFVNEEVWHKKRDGTTFPTLMNATLITDEDGKPLFFAAAAVDITDRKQAELERARLEEQLRQAQKMEAVGTLSSGIAHDFNNLLTAIFGYTDLAKTTLDDDHPAIRALEMVEESATQARGVTNSLLTFSHKKVSRKEPTDLVQTVSATTSLLRRVLPASTELVEDLPEGMALWVNADATQIQQILMNLAVNARDAMPEGGRLRIALQEVHRDDTEPGRTPAPHGRARLLVEDDGTGMTEDVRSRVFEPFFTTKPRGQGTGLGLSVIHGIVTDHDGRIELESSPGQGTRVAILLPRCPPPEASQTSPLKRPRVKGHGEVILVVEDNELVRSIMTSALRSWGYQVLPATDGEQAVRTLHARREAVQLVILDLDLPKANGLSILHETRRKHADLPIIVVTGTVDIHPEEHLRASDALLRKPFQMSDLTALVAQSLAGPRRKKGGE